MKSFIFGLMLSLTFTLTRGQERNEMVGIHTAMDFFSVDNISNSEKFREGFQLDTWGGNYLNTDFYRFYGFAAYEFSAKNPRFRFTTGLKYSGMIGNIKKDNFLSTGSSFFFYRLREEGTDTEYVSLTKISQNSHYLAVPIEVRWFPFDGKRVRFYVKGGADINVLIYTKNKIDFYEPTMRIHQNEIAERLDQPSRFNGILALAGGVRIGKEGAPAFGFELSGPAVFIGGRSAGIVHPGVGGGLQVSLLLPIKKQQHAE
jgi:hypothetical protein